MRRIALFVLGAVAIAAGGCTVHTHPGRVVYRPPPPVVVEEPQVVVDTTPPIVVQEQQPVVVVEKQQPTVVYEKSRPVVVHERNVNKKVVVHEEVTDEKSAPADRAHNYNEGYIKGLRLRALQNGGKAWSKDGAEDVITWRKRNHPGEGWAMPWFERGCYDALIDHPNSMRNKATREQVAELRQLSKQTKAKQAVAGAN